MSLVEILAAAETGENTLTARVPDTWMQGRTAYGGLSAALALEAAIRSQPDLPPLRSAQIAFVGPLAGEVTVETRLLRRGRRPSLETKGIFTLSTNWGAQGGAGR